MVTGMRLGAWFAGLGRVERLLLVWLACTLIVLIGGLRMHRDIAGEPDLTPLPTTVPVVTDTAAVPDPEPVPGAPYEPNDSVTLALGETFRVADEEVRLLNAGQIKVLEIDTETAPVLTVEAFPGRFAGSPGKPLR